MKNFYGLDPTCKVSVLHNDVKRQTVLSQASPNVILHRTTGFTQGHNERFIWVFFLSSSVYLFFLCLFFVLLLRWRAELINSCLSLWKKAQKVILKVWLTDDNCTHNWFVGKMENIKIGLDHSGKICYLVEIMYFLCSCIAWRIVHNFMKA